MTLSVVSEGSATFNSLWRPTMESRVEEEGARAPS